MAEWLNGRVEFECEVRFTHASRHPSPDVARILLSGEVEIVSVCPQTADIRRTTPAGQIVALDAKPAS